MSNIPLNNIINFLNELFPEEKAEKWDNVGFEILEVFNDKALDSISKVVVCLDVTNEVIDFAIKNNVNLIITRHPFFFGVEDSEDGKKIDFQSDYKNEILKKAIENKVQFYAIHTNYDWSQNQGVFSVFSKNLNSKKIEKIAENDYLFRITLASPMARKELYSKFKEIFNVKDSFINLNTDLEEEVKDFYYISGSGAEVLVELDLNNTTLVTGEVKWHQWISANQNNVKIIELGHYMENVFINDIKEKLNVQFGNDLDVLEFDIKNQNKHF